VLATRSHFFSIAAFSVYLLLLGPVCLSPRVCAQSPSLQPEVLEEASPVLTASESSTLPDAPQSSSPPPTSGSQESNKAGSATPQQAKPDNQTAGEQLKEEERQRILGVLPNFNTVNSQNALPLRS